MRVVKAGLKLASALQWDTDRKETVMCQPEDTAIAAANDHFNHHIIVLSTSLPSVTYTYPKKNL